MQVREARPDDVDEIVRLKRVIMETAYPFDVELDQHPEWPGNAARAVRAMMDHPDYVFYVVEAESTTGDAQSRDADAVALVGCISAGLTWHVPGPKWGPLHAHLGDMCTDDAVRGTGVGRLLMDAVLAWCREHGAASVRLDATPTAVAITSTSASSAARSRSSSPRCASASPDPPGTPPVPTSHPVGDDVGQPRSPLHTPWVTTWDSPGHHSTPCR